MVEQRDAQGRFLKGHKVRRKTRKQRAFEEAKAVEMGKVIGAQKAHEKKSFTDSLREHIGKMIDRVDPVKLALLGITALLVYQTIKSSEGLVDELRRKVPLVTVGNDPTGQWLRNTFGTTFFATLADIELENKGQPAFNLGQIVGGITPEHLISIIIAYLIVYEPRALAETFKTIGGGIVGFAKQLAGIA